MITPQKYYNYILAVHTKKIDWTASSNLKWVLTNSAPTLTHTQLSDLTQITNGNGYTTGGTAMVITSCTQTLGVLTILANDVVFTGSGGGMATFQTAHLYDDASTGDLLICCANYGRGITLASGQTHTIDIDPVLGLLSAN